MTGNWKSQHETMKRTFSTCSSEDAIYPTWLFCFRCWAAGAWDQVGFLALQISCSLFKHSLPLGKSLFFWGGGKERG